MLTCCVYPGYVFSLSKLFSPVSMCEKWNKSQMGTSAQGYLGVCKRRKKTLWKSWKLAKHPLFVRMECTGLWMKKAWKCLSSFHILFCQKHFLESAFKIVRALRCDCYEQRVVYIINHSSSLSTSQSVNLQDNYLVTWKTWKHACLQTLKPVMKSFCGATFAY